MLRPLAACAVLGLVVLAGCTDDGSLPLPGEDVSVDPPQQEACRVLEPADIAEPTNNTETVSCRDGHTAETFVVGAFRGDLSEAEYGDPALDAEVAQTCSRQFRRFTGADDSLALRSILSWAWFRPSEEAWDEGARWFRCDVVGGTAESASLAALPKTAKGVLLGIPGDRWMACVDAPEVAGAVAVPCTENHQWRAVSTIVVGEEKEKYPGDRLVEVRSRDFCSDWVGAWMNYPIDYEYAWTWFGKEDWEAGNRRSVCWARTDQ